MMGSGLVYTAKSQTYTGTDSFTYTISDGHGGTSTGTVTITLTNTPPVAWGVTMWTTGGMTVLVPALSYDPDGDTVTITGVTQPAPGSGSVALTNGMIYYSPPSGYSGVVTFTYTVSDGHGGTATATVTVTVSA